MYEAKFVARHLFLTNPFIMRGVSAPLHDQAEQLRKALESREKRRAADRAHRTVCERVALCI